MRCPLSPFLPLFQNPPMKPLEYKKTLKKGDKMGTRGTNTIFYLISSLSMSSFNYNLLRPRFKSFLKSFFRVRTLSLFIFLMHFYSMYISTIISLANTDSNYITVKSSSVSTNWRDSLVGLPLTISYVANPWTFHML